jgi:hypothetical protein
MHKPLFEILGDAFWYSFNTIEVDLIARAVGRRAPRLHAIAAGDQPVLAQPAVTGVGPLLQVADRDVVVFAWLRHR